MPKLFVSVALALAMSCCFAAFSTNNYVKTPGVVCDNNDYNYTNTTGISLQGITVGDVYLVSENVTINQTNISSNKWDLWYKEIDMKAFTTGPTQTAQFHGPSSVFFYNNYVVYLLNVNTTGVPQLTANQLSLNGGSAVSVQTLSSNTNSSFTPELVSFAMIDRTVYVFYLAAYRHVIITKFRVGGSEGSLNLTLSSTFDTPSSFSVVWGESLGNNQLYATWVENGLLKDALINMGQSDVTPTWVAAYNSSFRCNAFATDKKYFGTLCTGVNTTSGNITYYVRIGGGSSSLLPFAYYTSNTSALTLFAPYGPYLALIYRDVVTAAPSTSYSYEIWDFDTMTTFKSRTQFLVIDSKSWVSWYRVPQGGLYTLLYNPKLQANQTITSVAVGLLLGSSYLASVLGFLLIVVTSLFIF